MTVLKQVSAVSCLALLLFFCLLGRESRALAESESPRASNNLLVLGVEINGPVSQATSSHIERAIEQAKAQGAQGILLRIDTPGGSLEATRLAVSNLIQSEVPLFVYIGPRGARAGSAGVFFTLAAHRVGMAEATRLGAAHPVSSGGKDIEGDIGEKVENDTVSWARSLAELRSRPVDWAEKAVRESATLTVQQALEMGMADIQANSEREFLDQLGAEKQISPGSIVQNLPMTTSEQIVAFLSDPNLIYVMLLAGMFGLFIEFKSPGLIIPGALGAFLLALVFGVQSLPINGFALVLMAAGAVLLVADLFVTSLGLLSVAGVTSLIVGSYLLFDDGRTLGTSVSEPLIWIVGGVFSATVILIGSLIAKAQFMSHHKDSGPDREASAEGLPPRADVTLEITSGRPGKIFYKGSYWNAVAAQSSGTESDRSLPEGTHVEILSWDGLTAHVAAVKPNRTDTTTSG